MAGFKGAAQYPPFQNFDEMSNMPRFKLRGVLILLWRF
jgi:hypothetical protein